MFESIANTVAVLGLTTFMLAAVAGYFAPLKFKELGYLMHAKVPSKGSFVLTTIFIISAVVLAFANIYIAAVVMAVLAISVEAIFRINRTEWAEDRRRTLSHERMRRNGVFMNFYDDHFGV